MVQGDKADGTDKDGRLKTFYSVIWIMGQVGITWEKCQKASLYSYQNFKSSFWSENSHRRKTYAFWLSRFLAFSLKA